MTMPERPRDDLDAMLDEVATSPTAAAAYAAAQASDRAQRPYAPPEAPGELAARIEDSLDDDRTAARQLRRLGEGLALAADGFSIETSQTKRGLAQAAEAAIELAADIEQGVAQGEATAAAMRERFGDPQEEAPE
jgi:hypothetical protein